MNMEKIAVASSLRTISVLIAKIADRINGKGQNRSSNPARRAANDSYLIERDSQILAGVARIEYDYRRSRGKYIDTRLLGEPVWDLLLDLFIQKINGRLISTTSAAIAAGASVSTALRYFSTLEEAGLIVRTKSQTDARVNFVSLTDEGYRRIGSYLRDRASTMDLQFVTSELLPSMPMDGPFSNEPIADD